MLQNKLSTLQQFIWLDQQLDPASPKYNIGGYAIIQGSMDVEKFRYALRQFFQAQEILRYRFAESKGVPYTTVADYLPEEVLSVDVAKDASSAISEFQQDFSRPFQLNTGRSLVKMRLVQISGTNKYLWYTKVHHLLADGFSFQLLFNEVGRNYSIADTDNPRSGVDKVQKQYAVYARESFEYRSSPAFEKDLEFWRSQYEQHPRLVFNDRVGEAKFFERSLAFSATEYEEMQATAKTLGVSVLHLILTGCAKVFATFFRTNEVNFGTPLLNRTNRADRSIFGPFINMLPLSVNLGEVENLAQLAKRIKRQVFSNYRHQRVQPAEMIKALGFAGKRMHDFRISYEQFNYQQEFGPFAAEIVALSNRSEEDPLSVHIMDYQGGGLDCRFDFNGSHIAEYVADELLSSLYFLLTSLGNNLHKSITELSLCTPEQSIKLAAWGQGQKQATQAQNFPETWKKVVASHADRIALIFGEQSATYQEVDHRSDQITYALQRHGIGKGDRVGLILDRSMDVVPAMLGVLGAGAAYVPIDPTYPEERINFMLADADVRMVMTNRPLPKLEQKVLELQQVTQMDTMPRELERPSIDPQDEAYVIYTSGSTGQPKGVAIRHASLIDYASSFAKYFKLEERDNVLQQANYVFDTSVEEIYPILSVGGTLVIAEHPKDFNALLETCCAQEISLLSTNPYLVQYLNHEYGRFDLSLRVLISGGDVLKPSQVDQLLHKVAVYNTYGPTESTVCATYHRVTSTAELLPIGRPIANRSVILLQEDQRIPPGGVGEIVLGGAGLAKGYLNQPIQTAAAFVEIDGEHYYRTGDLGQWNEAGELLFLGRKDQQLSFKGFRIEPQEIEKAILRTNEVAKDALAIVRNLRGAPSLVAYVVVEEGQELDTIEVQKKLKSSLPSFMLPDQLVVIESFPLNASGKIDVKQLPLPQVNTVERVIEAAVTTLEKQLAAIWCELLDLDSVGRNESFFELGGHSLLANQFVGQVREKRQQDISLKTFYEQPTIGDLAKLLEQSPASQSFQLKPAPQLEVYPLSFPQERLWFLNELNEKNKAYYVPRAIKMTGQIDVSLIAKTFTLLIEKHEVLRTQFPVVNGVPKQRIVAPFEFEVPLVSLEHLSLSEQGPAIEAFIMEEGKRKFDLNKDPLIRVHVLRRSEKDNILVFCEHHIIHDGWTQGVLLREFIDTYEKLLSDPDYRLEKPALQFKDFAYWQRSYFTEEVFARHAKFWQSKLEGHLPLLPLPTKGPRPKEISGNGRLLEFTLDGPFAQEVRRFSKDNNATLFITMLAAFKMTLSYFSKETDICIGTAAANRRLTSVSSILGMIINTIAVRTRFDKEESLFAIFEKVRESCFETYAYEDTPFDKVVQFVEAERDLSINPIFQYNFSFMNTPSRNLYLPDLSLEIMDSHNHTAKFDLNIVVVTPREQSQQAQMDLAADNRIIVEWEYNSDIFTESLMDLMMEVYQKFLRAIVETGNTKFVDVQPLSSKAQPVVEISAAPEIGAEYLVLNRFAENVARHPNRTALVYEKQSVSYRELDRVSSQLALYLSVEHGTKKGQIVGLFIDRDHWQIISILALLKSGCAYLPIHPDTPEQRKQEMLQNAGASSCIENQGIQAFQEKAQDYVADKFKAAEVAAHDLAYVIYTSGSTGKSKGVMINHGNLAYSTYARSEVYRSEGSFLLLSSISFDSSVAGIFHSLAYGKSLHLTSDANLKDPVYLAKYIQENEITTFLSIPAYAELILESMPVAPTTLREVIVAGEYCSTQFIESVYGQDRFANVILFNEYGPTEATVWASYHRYERGQVVADTIGQPIPGLSTYVLDEHDNCLPDEIIGELAVAGPTLSPGYLNNPELTAEKFKQIVLPTGDAVRVYKTGDLVVRDIDGNLTYKGRKDHQVKIRGYRIELAEIEKILAAYPEVERAVVLTYETENAGLILRAFYEADQEIPEKKLKRFIADRLPRYMLPANFTQLPEFTTNQNGKVDREALNAIPMKRKESRSERVLADEQPSELESNLLDRWSEVLNMNNLSVYDDFFDLGGTSIQAIYASKLGEVEFPVKFYFEYRTVRAIAEQIETQRDRQQETVLKELVTGSSSPLNLLLIPYAGALEASYYQLANSLKKSSDYNVYEVADFRDFLTDQNWRSADFLAAFREAIIRFPRGSEFVLYGHCAGSALTLLLAKELETMGANLRGVFVGGSLPQTNTGSALIGEDVETLLSRLSDNLQLLPAHEKQLVIDNFTTDHRIALDIRRQFAQQAAAAQPLNTPLHCVFGSQDPLTEGYAEHYVHWQRFSREKVAYTELAGGNHYFVNEMADQSAQIILAKINEWHAVVR